MDRQLGGNHNGCPCYSHVLCERDPTLLLDELGRLESIVETSLDLFEPFFEPSLIVDTSQPELLG